MRTVISLNEGWQFVHSPASPEAIPAVWEPVTLPHSWNAVDGHDGKVLETPPKDWAMGDLSGPPEDHYDRGSYWYFRRFETPRQPLSSGRVYVEIPAAGQQAAVYVNGQKAAEHLGGYSRFRADITELCRDNGGENLLAVNVSNEYRTDVYPQHADFSFYGGLYRGVNLISVPEAHFSLDYFGGDGLKVTSRLNEDGSAVMELEAFVTGADETRTVYYEVLDPEGREIAGAGRPAGDAAVALPIPDPAPWSPDSPALYTVTASLLWNNEVCDAVRVRTGFRRFACTPDGGFFLNGKSLPLRGVCRHQDLLYQGNALTAEDHWRDALLIREMGANTVRLAHYQHAQDFYDACDELGLVVWAEIPFITIMNEDPAAHENCLSQMRELVIQNYNHPCICFWGLSNEVLLAGKLSEKLVENHRELNALVKSLDPTRLTTIAHVTMTPEDCGLHGITDVEAYNHYFGWYVGKKEDNGPWLDAYHAAHPDRCLGMSEYGCEGIIRYHSSDPKPRDYSEEYQALYHEELVRVFAERPWVWGSFVWNMFDFGAAARNEGGVAGRNNKGLMTMDRKIRKDSYYIYKAFWTSEPMVHLCGKRYARRAGENTEIRVYSNQPEVTLYLDGAPVETKRGDKVFVFTAALSMGFHSLTARAGGVSDTAVLERVAEEPVAYRAPQARR
ncbi:MAG: beta-galactosidase [Oscillospiraceae bacterium]|nr:beta-galactosidase [Oscillospiraceae bacterium]